MRRSSAIHILFVFTGVANTLLGPLLPSLIARWSLPDGRAGLLFSSEFAGAMLGTLASLWLAGRIGAARVLTAGSFCMAAGIAALARVNYGWGLASLAWVGLGLGLVIPAANVAVAQGEGGNSAPRVSRLNAAWGAGAIASPLPLAWMPEHWRAYCVLLGGLFLVVALVVAAGRQPGSGRNQNEPAPAHTAGPGTPASVALLAVMAWLYAGTEAAVAGWIPAYDSRSTAGLHQRYAMSAALFWLALVSIRLAAGAMLRRVTARAAGLAGLLLAAAAIAAMLWTHVATVGALLAGLGFGLVFPLLIAKVAGLGRRASTLFFLSAGFGGVVIPWSMGQLSAATSLGTAFLLPLAITLLMAALLATGRV
ncbi:MAG: MFS transporter [Acidobacteria bacterium]|nr:MFS transporter [Acidobacteriota bacterium]